MGAPFYTSDDMKNSAYIDPDLSRSLKVLKLTRSQISQLHNLGHIEALGGSISYL